MKYYISKSPKQHGFAVKKQNRASDEARIYHCWNGPQAPHRVGHKIPPDEIFMKNTKLEWSRQCGRRGERGYIFVARLAPNGGRVNTSVGPAPTARSHWSRRRMRCNVSETVEV
ncbi:hypothetical protein J6590_010747 [Homalodisca vitripennis]|nr:hypothetical protein J6590_010747 [Homalodisca vitripennis]